MFHFDLRLDHRIFTTIPCCFLANSNSGLKLKPFISQVLPLQCHFSPRNFSCLHLCDQRYQRRFTRKRRSSLPVLVIIPLNFHFCTVISHMNIVKREVALKSRVTVSCPRGVHKHFFDRDARPRTNFNYQKK